MTEAYIQPESMIDSVQEIVEFFDTDNIQVSRMNNSVTVFMNYNEKVGTDTIVFNAFTVPVFTGHDSRLVVSFGETVIERVKSVSFEEWLNGLSDKLGSLIS